MQLRKDYLPPRLALAQIAIIRGEYENAAKISEEALKINWAVAQPGLFIPPP